MLLNIQNVRETKIYKFNFNTFGTMELFKLFYKKKEKKNGKTYHYNINKKFILSILALYTVLNG